MKKFILFSFVFVFSLHFLTAQSLILQDSHGGEISGSTITINGTTQDSELEYHVHVNNTSGAAIGVKITQTQADVPDGSVYSYCWDNCYTNPAANHTTIDSIEVDAGATDETFSTHYRPEGTTGTATFRYLFFDCQNPNDTAVVTVIFDVSSTNISEVNQKDKVLSLYPNPVKSTLNIDYQTTSPFAYVKICNIIGEIVKTVPLIQARNSTRVNVSDLKRGIYLVSLIENHKVVRATKLIVAD